MYARGHLPADLMLYHRMGYSDASLNDCHFVANARFSKSLLKGRLGLSHDAYDIFQGQSNVKRVLNAQGIQKHGITHFHHMLCFK